MHDFYAPPRAEPLDQADGLRRMFANRQQRVLALVANPHVAFSSVVLDRLAAVLSGATRQVLVVDAASASPPPQELAALDLAACIETISPHVSYLPAGGLAMAYVDTRGSAAAFIDAALAAAPQAELLLLHADASDLARIFKHRALRPLLIGADHPESIKHAYAGAKLLTRRCELLTFDLLLAASPQSPRAASIGESLAGCLETFLGAVLCHTALIDPAGDPAVAPDAALSALLCAQLTLGDAPFHAAAAAAAASAQSARPAFR